MKQSFDAGPEGGLIEEVQSLNFSVFECKFLGTTGNRAADLGYGEMLISSSILDDVFVIIADGLSVE